MKHGIKLKVYLEKHLVVNQCIMVSRLNLKRIHTIQTNFYGNMTAIDGEYYTFFSVILLYSIVNVDKKYHPQILSNECKYAIHLMNDEN